MNKGAGRANRVFHLRGGHRLGERGSGSTKTDRQTIRIRLVSCFGVGFPLWTALLCDVGFRLRGGILLRFRLCSIRRSGCRVREGVRAILSARFR